jgi:hypothetical protein
MRILALIVAVATLSLWAGRAEAVMEPVIPTYEQVTTPAGVAEYKEAATVALARPHRVWTPPCALVRLADFVRGLFPNAWLGSDVCGPRERSRRYRFEAIETFKGAPPAPFPALLRYNYPLDPDFMRKTRPDLWGHVFDADKKRAAKLHAGFSFLHAGGLNDREVDVEAPFDPPRVSDGSISYALLDPDLDYLVFRDADGEIRHWEPVQRGAAGKDLLVARLRRLKAGETDVRLTVAPADLFPRFVDAAIYDVSGCKPRLAGGGRLAILNRRIEDVMGSDLVGPGRCDAKTLRPQRFLALTMDSTSWPYGFWEHGATVLLLPIVDGKIRPGDLVSQLRLAPDTPILAEQVIAWVGTGPGAEDFWQGDRPQDPPLRLAAR